MPILLEGRADATTAGDRRGGRGAAAGPLEIGLVNNMPDGALQATERQFADLLGAACGTHPVRLHLFALPGVERGAAAAAHIAAGYGDLDGAARLDGLIVTGCEPRAASLPDEPFWPAFARLVDWAERHTASTLWSCLAAHAAVLHLDGVVRRRLPAKRAGVFAGTAARPHPLLAGMPGQMQVAHSRWNDLAEADLAAHGYDVLTRSAEAGVDLFAKRWNSLFVFVQGHPEYDAGALAREYRRDLARFLRGERPDYPGLPRHYFDPPTQAALTATRTLALADPAAVRLADLPRLAPRPGLADACHATSLPLFQNWITLLATLKTTS